MDGAVAVAMTLAGFDHAADLVTFAAPEDRPDDIAETHSVHAGPREPTCHWTVFNDNRTGHTFSP